MQPLFSILIPLALAIVIILGRAFYGLVVDHLPPAERAKVQQVMGWAEQVVHAVEQSMPNSIGQDKKTAAVTDLVAIAKAVGLKLPAALVETAIESAVFSMNLWKKASPGAVAPTS